MCDIHVLLPDEPGALARFGRALGGAGVSLEGGGVFTVNGVGQAISWWRTARARAVPPKRQGFASPAFARS